MKNAEQPLEWYKVMDDKGCLAAPSGLPLNNIANRQTNAQYLLPNGSIYIFNIEALKNHKKYYFDNTRPYIMPTNRSIDIDTQQDFEYAEFILSRNSHAN